MLLTVALFRSRPGIAFRMEVIHVKRSTRVAYTIAFVTDKKEVWVFNGRNGAIRHVSNIDQRLDSWHAFQESPDMSRTIKQIGDQVAKEIRSKRKVTRLDRRTNKPKIYPLRTGPPDPEAPPLAAAQPPPAPKPSPKAPVIEPYILSSDVIESEACPICTTDTTKRFFVTKEEWICEGCYTRIMGRPETQEAPR